MIDELVEYKKAHFPDDRRRILTCGGTPHGTLRVEWLPPAAPGVGCQMGDGPVRDGEDGAGRGSRPVSQEDTGMSRSDAQMKVAKIAMELGMV